MSANSIQPRTFDAARVRQNFSGISPFYDRWAQLTESKAVEHALELANLQPGEAVLDAGVGTGLLFEKLLHLNQKGFTAGVDISPAMLEQARKRVQHYKSDREFSLQEASVYDLPFTGQSFDCLFSCYVLDLLPEKDFAYILKEFKRLLKPGGRLVLVSMTFGWKWYQHLWEKLSGWFPGLFTDCRPVDLRPFLREAGFEIIETDLISQNTFPSQVLLARRAN